MKLICVMPSGVVLDGSGDCFFSAPSILKPTEKGSLFACASRVINPIHNALRFTEGSNQAISYFTLTR